MNVFILSLRDFLKKELVDKLSLHSEIEVFSPPVDEHFWHNFSAIQCDLLFLDEMITDTDGQKITAQNIVVRLKVPIVIISSGGIPRRPLIDRQKNILGTVSDTNISSFTIDRLLRKADLVNQYCVSRTESSSPFSEQIPLLDHLNQAAIAWDTHGLIIICNHTAEILLGISSTQLCGRNINSAFFSLFQPSFNYEDYANAPDASELNYVDPCGRERTFNFQYLPFCATIKENQLAGFIAHIREITDQKALYRSHCRDRQFIDKLIETIPSCIFIWDLQEQRVSFINSAIEDILGFEPAEILHKNASEIAALFFLDNHGEITRHFESIACFKNDKFIENELHIRNKQYEWCWVRTREIVFSFDENGTPNAIIGSAENITQLKLTQKKLEKRLQSEGIFSEIIWDFISHGPKTDRHSIQAALEKIQDFIAPKNILIYKRIGTRLHKIHEVLSYGSSSMYSEFLQMENLSVIQESLLLNNSFFFSPEMKIEPALMESISILFDRKISNAGIFPITTNNILLGIVVFVPQNASEHWSSFDIRVARTFTSILSFVFYNQKTEQEICKKPALLNPGPENNRQELICRFDTSGLLTYVNHEYCALYDCSKNMLLGKHFLEYALPDHRENILSLIGKMDQDQAVQILEFSIQLPSGDIRKLQWECRAILNSCEQITEYYSFGRDITDWVMQEGFLPSQPFTDRNERMSSIQQLSTSISHQISNPLTTIIADAQILLYFLDKEHPGRASAEAIYQAGWQVQKVIQMLMDISQAKPNQNEWISINETIEGALLLTSAYMLTANMAIIKSYDENLPNILGNSCDLTHVWINLLLAAHAAAENGQITKLEIFTQEISSDWIEVKFQYNGEVVAHDPLETVIRIDTDSESSLKDLGEDLNICREIINNHEGFIQVETPGFSTILRVRLPKGMN